MAARPVSDVSVAWRSGFFIMVVVVRKEEGRSKK